MFSEAPTQVQISTKRNGFSITLTLRDDDGAQLMPKLMQTLDWLATNGFEPADQVHNDAAGIAPSATGDAPICPTHKSVMKHSQHGGWFCPVKIADDDGRGKPVYCKQSVK